MKTLETIYNSTEKLLIPLTLEETYSKIMAELLKLSGADGGHIILYKDGDWQRVYCTTHSEFFIKPRKKGGLSYTVFKSGRPAVFSREEALKSRRKLSLIKFKWATFIPLSYSQKSTGVIILTQNKGRKLNKRKLEVLQLFASLATLAIRKNQLYEDLRDALESRDLFISMAAHELKTPLTIMNVYVQLLHKKISDKEAIDEKLVEELLKANDRLKKLIMELLQIEQIKKGDLEYDMRKIHLKKIIERAVADFKLFYPKHQLIIDDKLDKSSDLIEGDFNKLLQVLNNLLNNAAKFSKEGSEIIIAFNVENAHFIISVRDQGEGINKTDLDKVFNKFYKGNKGKREGMGLGLYLAQKIIKKHRGNIAVDSVKNRGTTVKISLPVVSYE